MSTARVRRSKAAGLGGHSNGSKGATHGSLLPASRWPRSCDRENLNPVESLVPKNAASGAYK